MSFSLSLQMSHLCEDTTKRELENTDNDPATLTKHNESCQTLVRATHMRLKKKLSQLKD